MPQARVADDVWVVCGTHEMPAVRPHASHGTLTRLLLRARRVVVDGVDGGGGWRVAAMWARKVRMGT
jgi:hypothetical protein